MEPEVDAAATVAETRAYGDKTPKVMMYIEVNDTNPLNTMLYRMNGEPFIDITTIFAANIRANGSEPALWLNDNVTQLLIPSPATSTTTGHYKYVQPIRQDGGKVLLTILGDHQGVGVANLTAANQAKFAKFLHGQSKSTVSTVSISMMNGRNTVKTPISPLRSPVRSTA